MSDFRLSFDPLFSWWIVLSVSIFAFALFLRFELKRNQALLIPRIIALILILISILALLLRPFYKTEKKTEAVLLTPNFERSKVDSWLSLEPQVKIIRLVEAKSYPNSETFISFQSLFYENIKYIFGEGIPGYALDLLSKRDFQFIPCRLPFGVVELTVPEIFSNRRNSFYGSFNSPGKTKLKLVGPSGVEDSINLSPGNNSFMLSFHPKQSGLFLYDFISADSLGNTSSEKLPIEVIEERALRILFVQKFPSAEMRYLKNFLAGKGHGIAVRTQTSKNNFNEEFINSPKTRLSKFTNDLLGSFDLVLIDSKTIDQLTKDEKSTLQKSVFKGLGLIVVQNDASSKTDFYLNTGKKIYSDTVRLRLPSAQRVLPALPFKVSDQPSIESVIKSKDRVLAGYRFFGAGKIAFQFLQETYRLALEGLQEDYAFVWTSLIERSARKQNKKFDLKLISTIPYYPNELLRLSILSSEEKPAIHSDGIKVPAKEDVLLDDYWETKSWAGKFGWHQFTANDSTTLNYFVSEPNEWKSLRISNQMRETSLAQATQPKNLVLQFENKKISALLFYLIFVLASGFLWLASRLNSSNKRTTFVV